MKLLKRKLKKQYKVAHYAGKKHFNKRPYIVPALGVLIGVGLVLASILTQPVSKLRPSESRVVFLSDNGVRTTLDTKAATVGDLIKKLPNLKLVPEDVVEPALDTPIVQDNFRINIYRSRPVTVTENGTKTVTLTAQRSARVVAQNAGLTVYPEDNVSFAPGDIHQNIIGEQVVVDPATPVALSLYGTPLDVRTHAKTVADLLTEKNVKIDPKDTIKPDLKTPITSGLGVSIIRNGVHVVTIELPIDISTQYVNDNSLSFGSTAVRQAGSTGKKVVTYQIDVEGGVEVSRTVIQETTTLAAVPKIIAIGTVVDIGSDKTGVMAAAGIASADYAYVDYIISHESGWCYTKWQGQVGYCPASYSQIHDPDSGYGFGLCQATPAGKMVTAGGDWATSPLTQLKWCSGYAHDRYGSWYAAYNHWLNYHNW